MKNSIDGGCCGHADGGSNIRCSAKLSTANENKIRKLYSKLSPIWCHLQVFFTLAHRRSQCPIENVWQWLFDDAFCSLHRYLTIVSPVDMPFSSVDRESPRKLNWMSMRGKKKRITKKRWNENGFSNSKLINFRWMPIFA